ncbi:DJ-1/PfpI family protein [Aeromicrobium endophyticum]|uniref:DJ-1/PfpI family protein n=1 Tax=Aeromicrobium endophyticum TaxID=2292704 RepID=A0A371NYZ5_9ACTN|nr:DJ-1/PfpI family protein [Aeromicrobium endophyticum]REK68909.1 DJ-1/PfpI family protein [Aeromicrobium endophyticum]
MQIAIVLYPEFTALDVIGPYEVLSRIPGAEVVFAAHEPGDVADATGSLLVSAMALDDVSRPDVVLVGGGPGQAGLMADGPVHRWLRAVDPTSTWMSAVSTGSLILASAGLLGDREVATHWLATGQLAVLGAKSTSDRVVIDGKYATAAGVSAGIDLALTLAGLIAGDEVAQAIQLIVEYSPEPPYASGTPESASPRVVERVLARRDELLGTT